MTNNINECINELKEIFIYENIYLKEDYINNWRWSENSFYNKFGNNSLFVISCEFIPRHEEDIINIHYDLNYWGSNKFNQILEKYNLKFDWVNNCSCVVFYKND